MEMADGGNIPRMTCEGACQEDAGAVDEVGEDFVYKFLRKPGDW